VFKQQLEEVGEGKKELDLRHEETIARFKEYADRYSDLRSFLSERENR
jgi:vacuolar-type H+-ATPase subunit D/Vma8